ncbi:MAG: SLATT domain-containing protein [Rhodospirillaceae bacterium]
MCDKGKPASNWPMFRLPDLAADAWEPSKAEQSLDKIFAAIHDGTLELAECYSKKIKEPMRIALCLRRLAIVFGVLGGICPLIGDVEWYDFDPSLDRLGYIFIALAAGLVTFDKLYGSTAQWIRYTSAKLDLDFSATQFGLEWINLKGNRAGQPPTPDQITAAHIVIKNFAMRVQAIVTKETETWIADFQNGLVQLERLYKEDNKTPAK